MTAAAVGEAALCHEASPLIDGTGGQVCLVRIHSDRYHASDLFARRWDVHSGRTDVRRAGEQTPIRPRSLARQRGETIEPEVLRRSVDSLTWSHPRACRAPSHKRESPAKQNARVTCARHGDWCSGGRLVERASSLGRLLVLGAVCDRFDRNSARLNSTSHSLTPRRPTAPSAVLALDAVGVATDLSDPHVDPEKEDRLG